MERRMDMLTPRLRELENDAIYTIREARHRYRPIVLWSMGKDSTTLLWLIRKAYLGEVPFAVVHIDTSYKFAEMYEFRERIAREWQLRLEVQRNEAALDAGMSPQQHSRLECCSALKTDALKAAIAHQSADAVLLGIRGDEHAVRGKERVFSPRRADFSWSPGEQPPEAWNLYARGGDGVQHMRIHPMLRWREIDVWEYVAAERIPLPSLYFARDGRRYRSIGCASCCSALPSEAATVPSIIDELRTSATREREGRAQDKESAGMMEKLRALGYM
jgi:sulfate adenylyltransferase subunit 2